MVLNREEEPRMVAMESRGAVGVDSEIKSMRITGGIAKTTTLADREETTIIGGKKTITTVEIDATRPIESGMTSFRVV